MTAGPADPAGEPVPDAVARARALLDSARTRADAEPVLRPNAKVDKYFGEKLPPVCAQLRCYVTDDGKRFYCVNHACQKHKKRDTKHTRRGKPEPDKIVYFRCPRCDSRSIEMHLLSNKYVCRACKYNWDR